MSAAEVGLAEAENDEDQELAQPIIRKEAKSFTLSIVQVMI